MTDVRLTAVNPEDSQVYPVACNDKGELLLDAGGASGDLDVTGTLTVAGSATVAGAVTTNAQFNANRTSGSSTVFSSALNGSQTCQITADGSATFAGNVTAPNINFKLAPDLVQTLPAPLIDDGFATNDQIDLLAELIKIKIEIRDLNAFMQRTLQDENETTQ